MIDRVTDYANKVLDGTIIAGESIKKACLRHLKDLDKQGTEEFPYIFNIEEAMRIIEFAESLVIDEGGEALPLECYAFQDFILGSLMGWQHKDTGYRRFRENYTQLGRQNGKSLLSGVLAAYMSGFDNYKNGKIGCVATNLKQAKIVWDEIKKFITADEDLEELFHIVESDSLIVSKITKTKIQAMSRNWKSLDGFRYYLGVVDELHAHETNQFYKLVIGGQGKLKQCLCNAITTAGENLNSFCKEHYDFCKKILDGAIIKETQFVFIAEMDKEDDIWDYRNWIKANPLMFTDINNNINMDAVKVIEDLAMEARVKGGRDLADFMTKRLNIWVEYSEKQYMNIEKWKQGACELTLEDMKGKTCTLGIDLSKGGDLNSASYLFDLDNGSKFIYSHSYIPDQRVAEHEKTDLAPYRMWIRDGILTATNGYRTDHGFMAHHIAETIKRYELKVSICGYDTTNIGSFIEDLREQTYISKDKFVEIYQSHSALNDATINFKLEVDEGKIKYNKSEALLTWSMANAEIDTNKRGLIKIDKSYVSNRIDAIDATIFAYKAGMLKGIDLEKKIMDKDWTL